MKVKCCGINRLSSISAFASAGLDYMGFIFWKGTPRSALSLKPEDLALLPLHVRLVGVFVNETIQEMERIAAMYHLNHLQLHGQESPELCCRLRENGFVVIKSFPIATVVDLNLADAYTECCDYFLFDTKSSLAGGSGKQYDWSILDNYRGKTPFFLSGGIGLEDVERLRMLNNSCCYAVDINSRFEIAPGWKDIEKVCTFIKQVKTNK